MKNSRIPSPARSQGPHTPRRHRTRRTLSVGSNASARLTAVIENDLGSFALSPLVNRRSILSDNTDIVEPKRKSWWKNLGENSREVMDVLEGNDVVEPNNIIEELDMEVLSQEKKTYNIDMPESSDSESIDSIVIPQRKLFTQKENQQKQFGHIIGKRETLAKLHKTNTSNADETVNLNAKTKELFQNNRQRSRPLFPAGLLHMSLNKTAADKTKDFIEEPQVRTLFGHKQPTKRKNMFANFIVSESEDEISEINPKIFGFTKKTANKNRVSSKGVNSPSSSMTGNIEMDDWKHLPSSTMVDNQLEAMMEDGTPVKKAKIGFPELQAEDSDSEDKNLTLVYEEDQGNDNESVGDKDKTLQNDNNVNMDQIKENIESVAIEKQDNVATTEKHELAEKHDKSQVIEKHKKGEVVKYQYIDTENVYNELASQKGQEMDENYEFMIPDVITEHAEDRRQEKDEKNQEAATENQDEVDKNQEKIDGSQKVNTNEKEEAEDSQEEDKKQTEIEKIQYVIMDEGEAVGNQDEVDKGQDADKSNKETDESGKVDKSHEQVDHHADENQGEKVKMQVEIQEDDHVKEGVENEESDKSHKEVAQNQELHESLEVEVTQEFEESKCETDQNVEEIQRSRREIQESDEEVQESDVEAQESDVEAQESDVEAQESDVEAQESDVEAQESRDGEENESNNAVEEGNTDNEEIGSDLEESGKNEEESSAHENLEDSHQSNNDESIHQENQDDSNQSDNDESTHQEDSNQSDNDESLHQEASNQSQINESHQENPDDSNQSDNDESIHQEDSNQSDNDVSLHQENQEESNQSDQDESAHQENQEESNQSDNDEVDCETPNISHDTTGRNRNKNQSPEVILHESVNNAESFTVAGRNTSVRKTSIIKNLTIRPSLAPVRDSIGFSDGTKNSSAEGSGWDSHRTTRKTLRQTLGKGFSPRKSLRALVMEQSAKRHTMNRDIASETAKIPIANSTELPDMSDFHGDFENQESDHEVSRRTRQTTLEAYLQKIRKDNLERKAKMEEELRNPIKSQPQTLFNNFKVPAKPFPRKPARNQKPKAKSKPNIQLDLPEELMDDINYKPPKRFRPSNAPWITKRLYKYLETKLEPKYDYKARVRAEKLVETIYQFAKDLRRHNVASVDAVDVLKHEMARLQIVKTHYEFYDFFHQYMPREIRVKVVPDVTNKLPLPRHGVFTDILRENTTQG